MRLDRNASFAFQIHAIEDLLLHPSPLTVPVISRKRSARVDFPWSMWAIIQKFRICSVFCIIVENTKCSRRLSGFYSSARAMSAANEESDGCRAPMEDRSPPSAFSLSIPMHSPRSSGVNTAMDRRAMPRARSFEDMSCCAVPPA